VARHGFQEPFQIKGLSQDDVEARLPSLALDFIPGTAGEEVREAHGSARAEAEGRTPNRAQRPASLDSCGLRQSVRERIGPAKPQVTVRAYAPEIVAWWADYSVRRASTGLTDAARRAGR
jgi:hypothetical protein